MAVLPRWPVGIGCSKHRRLPKRAAPKLRGFRHDKFISFNQESGFGPRAMVRGLCQRLGKFEPEIGALANSPDSLISMVAAGRGGFVGPGITIRGRTEAIGLYPLLDVRRSISQNFSPAGATSPFVARAIPTGGGASVVPVSGR
jgi:hypothetical protein